MFVSVFGFGSHFCEVGIGRPSRIQEGFGRSRERCLYFSLLIGDHVRKLAAPWPQCGHFHGGFMNTFISWQHPENLRSRGVHSGRWVYCGVY